MPQIPVIEDAGSVELWFDLKLFEPEAIQRAALKLSSDAVVDLRAEGDGLACRISRRQDCRLSTTALADELRTEVIDEQLRATIAARTEAARNLVLAYAFSRTDLVTKP